MTIEWVLVAVALACVLMRARRPALAAAWLALASVVACDTVLLPLRARADRGAQEQVLKVRK